MQVWVYSSSNQQIHHSMSSDRVPARLHHRATGRVSNALAQPRRNRMQAGGSDGGFAAIWSAAAAAAAAATGATSAAGAAAGACGVCCCCWSKKLEQTKLEAGAACVQHQQLVAACHAAWVLEMQRQCSTAPGPGIQGSGSGAAAPAESPPCMRRGGSQNLPRTLCFSLNLLPRPARSS